MGLDGRTGHRPRGAAAIVTGLERAVRAPARTQHVLLTAGERAWIRVEPYGREEIQLITDWLRWPGYNGDEIDGLTALGWILDKADGTYFYLWPPPFKTDRLLDLVLRTLAVYSARPEDVEVEIESGLEWD